MRSPITNPVHNDLKSFCRAASAYNKAAERGFIMRIFTDKATGKKLYPVASWQNCQHIFYNYNDRMYNAFMDDPSDENEQKLDMS